jgi:hypothetical protein
MGRGPRKHGEGGAVGVACREEHARGVQRRMLEKRVPLRKHQHQHQHQQQQQQHQHCLRRGTPAGTGSGYRAYRGCCGSCATPAEAGCERRRAATHHVGAAHLDYQCLLRSDGRYVTYVVPSLDDAARPAGAVGSVKRRPGNKERRGTGLWQGGGGWLGACAIQCPVAQGTGGAEHPCSCSAFGRAAAGSPGRVTGP